MMFSFDAGDFHYEELPGWEEAEQFAKDNFMELLGEHVGTEPGPLWLTEGDTLQ